MMGGWGARSHKTNEQQRTEVLHNKCESEIRNRKHKTAGKNAEYEERGGHATNTRHKRENQQIKNFEFYPATGNRVPDRQESDEQWFQAIR